MVIQWKNLSHGTATGRRELDPYERWARERLEPVLGTLREIDPGGVPRPLHDFEADLPGGGIAAIEVTGQVEAKSLEQTASAQRRFDSFTLPGSSFVWQIGLDPAHASTPSGPKTCAACCMTWRRRACIEPTAWAATAIRSPSGSRHSASSPSARSQRSPAGRVPCRSAPALTVAEAGTEPQSMNG